MPKTDASLGPVICRRRRAQDRKTKAKATRQEKELQSARDKNKARAKPANRKTRRGRDYTRMEFFSDTGAIWYIIHNVQQQGFTMGTTDKDGKLAEYFNTPSIQVSYAQRTSMPLFGFASVSVWPNGGKGKKTITCLRFNARRVESFVNERTRASSEL